MRLRHFGLGCLVIPFLAGCVNDGATVEIDGTREHSLTVIREQPYFWDGRVNLSMVVSRMPACMRRHSMGPGFASTRIEVYQVPSGAFIIKVGKRMFATETQTCESFAKIKEEPDEMGTLIGTFREKNGQLVFIKEKNDNPEEAQ